MASKPKKPSLTPGVLIQQPNGGLPRWDEAQIQQENWGGSLGLPVRKSGAVVELRSTEGKIVVTPDEAQYSTFRECIVSFVSSTKGCTSTDLAVEWKRPVNIFAPFRPMVHRNMSPFLSPYSKGDERTLFDARAEEEAVKSVAVPSGKKGDTKAVAPPLPLHVQFPEIVRVLEPQALEGASSKWEGLGDERVVEQYRELQSLMQAYDPKLELGCAETPVEACESGYSTALRHRLNEVDEMSKMSEPPPFVMDAFNSAIKFIEYAQTSIKNGEYLWELVYPHAPGTCHPVYNPYGKYAVRLFIDGAFRRVTIDDYLPVDALGRPFLTITSQKEIWPALLAKAIFVALGPSRQALFSDPETIISCLRGEWIPQHVDPRLHPATACALLLAYRKDLPNSDTHTTHFSASTAEDTASAEVPEAHLSLNQQGSDDANGEVKAGDTTSGCSQEIPQIEEGVQNVSPPPVICAVSAMTAGRRKLFVIQEIVFFRSTLALRISTNPPNTIIMSKELTPQSEDEAVRELLRFSHHAEMERACHGSVPSQPSLWVTFEELSAHLDLVVWRSLGSGSPFRFCNRLVGADDGSSTFAGPRKKAMASATSAAPISSVKRNTVRWIHMTSDKAEQLALVSFPAPSHPVAGVTTTRSRPPSVLSASRPLSGKSASPSIDSRLLREEIKEVRLDLYTWNRGDVFSRASTFMYENGKQQCMVHTLPSGSHIFRLTAVGLEPQQALILFATQEFVMGDEKDILRSANIFKMSDAGIYPELERPNDEVVWFKRRITVKEPTEISFVVSTRDPSEDPAAHRDIPAILQKETKGTKTRAFNTKAPQKEVMEEVPQRVYDIPAIPYCRVLLLDLDTGVIRTGAVGRLVRQRLEPNHQGFLVMAYAFIDAATAEILMKTATVTMLEGAARPGDSLSSSNQEDKDNPAAHEKPPLLCGKGLWKLTIAADRPLDSYKSIPHSVFSFAEKGQLKRGSQALLFAYSCTVVEQTAFTLLLDLDARDPIPFYVRVMRSGVEAPPVYVSETCTNHLFISHGTLESGEKTRSATYIIEACLDEAKVQEWEERRRLAQELKFRALRANAEQKASEKRQQELEEHSADPRAFAERLEQQAATQVDVAAISTSREVSAVSTKKGRANGEKRKTVSNMNAAERAAHTSPGVITVPNPATLFLDTTDEALIVDFDLRLSFSAKVDVKSGAPPKDPLACLRGAWVPPIDHISADQMLSSAPRAGGTRGKQREMTPSAEELLLLDQGRMSRQRFLENPRGILLPYLMPHEEEGAAPSREISRAGVVKDGIISPIFMPRVVTDIEDEPNYLHAPILSESQYRIQLLPLRATEVSPPLHQSPPSASSGGLQQRVRSPNDRSSPRPGTSSPAAFLAPGVIEEDPDTAELKASVQELTHRLVEDLKHEHEKRAESRETIKEIVRHYWEPRRPETALISLLGAREDESSKRRKSRLKTAS